MVVWRLFLLLLIYIIKNRRIKGLDLNIQESLEMSLNRHDTPDLLISIDDHRLKNYFKDHSFVQKQELHNYNSFRA